MASAEIKAVGVAAAAGAASAPIVQKAASYFVGWESVQVVTIGYLFGASIICGLVGYVIFTDRGKFTLWAMMQGALAGGVGGLISSLTLVSMEAEPITVLIVLIVTSIGGKVALNKLVKDKTGVDVAEESK